MPDVPTLVFNDGNRIPQLGYGVFQVPPEEAAEHVTTALEAGYRHIDTAAAYENEEGVGKAIRDSGVPREEIFVTTKLWNSDQGYDETMRAFDASLDRLGLDRVDLYLIHWPLPSKDRYVDTWRAFEKIHADGRAMSIGVSNFTTTHLERLRNETTAVPALNQIEQHPGFVQQELRDYHREHGILTEAWSPIGQGQGLLEHPEIARVAEAHGKSPAQAVLRWHIQLGNVVIPKSVTPARIRENLDIFDFELSDDDMAALSGVEGHGRIGPDPEAFDVS